MRQKPRKVCMRLSIISHLSLTLITSITNESQTFFHNIDFPKIYELMIFYVTYGPRSLIPLFF